MFPQQNLTDKLASNIYLADLKSKQSPYKISEQMVCIFLEKKKKKSCCQLSYIS